MRALIFMINLCYKLLIFILRNLNLISHLYLRVIFWKFHFCLCILDIHETSFTNPWHRWCHFSSSILILYFWRFYLKREICIDLQRYRMLNKVSLCSLFKINNFIQLLHITGLNEFLSTLLFTLICLIIAEESIWQSLS